MDKFITIVLAGMVVTAAVVVLAILLTLPLMLLWNWLMPTIFGLCKISFMQAWGILVLSGLLFKGNSSTIKSKGGE